MTSVLDWGQRRAPRVVIDTHTVVTALMFGGGEAAELRQAWQDLRCLPMVCQKTELDLMTHLGDSKFGLDRYERQSLLQDYMRYAYRVKLASHDPEGEATLPGLSSVRLALAGRAHALITSDPELLSLADRLKCPVTSLGQFLAQLNQGAGDRRVAVAPLGPNDLTTIPVSVY